MPVLLGLLVACVDDAVVLPDPVDDALTTTAFVPPPPPADGVQLVVKGDGVRPGEEVEMCRYINVGNVDPGWVTKVEVLAAPGLHHSIVSRIGEEREDSESECFGFPDDLGDEIPLPIFATSTQVTEESIALPDGVGIELDARQQLIVNYHYLNYTDERIKPEIYLNLHFGEDEDIDSRAGFYSFTNFGDIAIPAGGTQRLTMTCPFDDAALLYSTTPHMHRMGRSFSLKRWDGTAASETIFEQEGWFDPITRIFDPPVLIGSDEGLTFTCEWQSDADHTTYFGESSEHEMCFVFGFFYPSQTDLIGMDGYGCTVDENVINEAPPAE